MLISHNQRDKSRFDLFWVNVVTGVSEGIRKHEYAGLFTDSQFQLRLATRLRRPATTNSSSGGLIAHGCRSPRCDRRQRFLSVDRFQRRRHHAFT